MRIATYRELQSKDELLPLFQQAFWWPFSPEEFEKTIKADPRLRTSPIGYAAMENDNLVGFVGVLDIATRILDGSEETVGGIWGVATHPAHVRKGISTALMRRSQEYFRERKYKFALLHTSKSLVAYSLYQKLDYRDAIIFPSAYKLVREPKKLVRKSGKKVKLDWNKILKIYSQATKNRTGFVLRDRQYGDMLEISKRIQPEKSIVTDKGYALLKEHEGNVAVQEIIALTKEELSKLITKIEEKATKTITYGAVLDKNIQLACQSRGYMVLKENYGVLMAKPLTNAVFTETYGDKFHATAADHF